MAVVLAVVWKCDEGQTDTQTAVINIHQNVPSQGRTDRKRAVYRVPSQVRTGQPVNHTLRAAPARAAPTSVTHRHLWS